MKIHIRLFIVFLVSLFLTSILPTEAVADSAGAYSLPTITSTICDRCGGLMVYAYQLDNYTDPIHVDSCLSTRNEYAPHTHRWHYIYHVYECSGCGIWGQKFISEAMQCSIGSNPYSLK